MLHLNKVCYSVPSVKSWDCHQLAITDGERGLAACCIYMWMREQYLRLMLRGEMLRGISLSRTLRKPETEKHSHVLFFCQEGQAFVKLTMCSPLFDT